MKGCQKIVTDVYGKTNQFCGKNAVVKVKDSGVLLCMEHKNSLSRDAEFIIAE